MKKVILLFGMLTPSVMGRRAHTLDMIKEIGSQMREIGDFERRLGIAQRVEPKLNQAIHMLGQLTDASRMGQGNYVNPECHKIQGPKESKCLGVAEAMKRVACFQPAVNDFELRANVWQAALPVTKNASNALDKVFDIQTGHRRLDGQPLIEVASKMLDIRRMQPLVTDMERRLGIAESDATPALQESVAGFRSLLSLNGRRLDGEHGHGGETSCINTLALMKEIESHQSEINDIKRRVGIFMDGVSMLETAIEKLQELIDVSRMGGRSATSRRLLRSNSGADFNIVKKWSLQNPGSWRKDFSWDGEKFPENRSPLQKLSDIHIQIEYLKSGKHMLMSSAGHSSSVADQMKEIVSKIPEIRRFETMIWKLQLLSRTETEERGFNGPLARSEASLHKVINMEGMKKRRLAESSSVESKSLTIEGMVSQVDDYERRLEIARSVEPLLLEIIYDLRNVTDISGMD